MVQKYYHKLLKWRSTEITIKLEVSGFAIIYCLKLSTNDVEYGLVNRFARQDLIIRWRLRGIIEHDR